MVHTYNNKDLNFLTVIEGFYFDSTYQNRMGRPYVDISQLHDFVLTSHTHHAHRKRLLRACSVYTPYGKRFLVITDILHISDPMSRHLAGNLYPVINFEEYGMRNPHMTNVVCDNSLVVQRINMQEHMVDVHSHYNIDNASNPDETISKTGDGTEKHVIHKSSL